MILRTSAIAIIGVTTFCVHAQSPTYTRKIEFRPVAMSQAELEQTLTRLRALISQANAGLEEKPYDESLTVSSDDVTLTLRLDTGRPLRESFDRFPRPATNVTYVFSAVRSAPIADARLDLRDFSRDLSVTGTAQEQVDAIVGVVSSDLDRAATFLGGWGFRRLGGAVLMLLGWAMTASPAALGRRGLSQRFQLVILLCGLFTILSTIFLPWERWFPGTSVYPVSGSFLERNSAAIGFWGVVISVITFALSVAYSEYLERRRSKSSPNGLTTKSDSSD